MHRRSFLQAAGSAAFLAGARMASAAPEEKTMLPFPIIDTHVHFWDPDHLSYDWIKGSPVLNRACLPKDHEAEAKPYTIDKLVFVQAECARDQWNDEAAWVSELAKEDKRIRGIVAAAPLEQGDGIRPTLEKLAEDPLLRGIRRLIQTEPAPGWCLQDGFVKGVQALEKVGFTFDLGITRNQLQDAAKLASRCPNVRFMVDHIGVPDIAGQNLDPWRAHLRALSELPNVYCKMSGVATAAKRHAWTPEELKPAISHVLDCFGFERTAYGSDWPVMLLGTKYAQWVDGLCTVVQGCSGDELRQLFRGTAEDFYRV